MKKNEKKSDMKRIKAKSDRGREQHNANGVDEAHGHGARRLVGGRRAGGRRVAGRHRGRRVGGRHRGRRGGGQSRSQVEQRRLGEKPAELGVDEGLKECCGASDLGELPEAAGVSVGGSPSCCGP